MSTKFISTNKNYMRLFNSPLDVTDVWDSKEELLEYIKTPTAYVNQLVGCEGNAYIIYINEHGEKDIKKASGDSVHIGPTPPEQTNGIIWVDTSTSSTSSFDDVLITEIRDTMASMQDKIFELETTLKNLILNGGGGGGSLPSSGSLILSEEEDVLVTEDNENLALESF